jgi:threonylcarbamoyladenosine tRNA methylthiotransferase MtaB
MGHFGVDTNNLKPGDPPERLWHLLRRLDRIPGDWRMRLSSIETVEVNDDFIKAAGDCEHLCPQFHPALQSGSNGVLTRMRRRYRVERFLERLDQIRETLGDDPAFSTDVIVGFPGETDAEFEETLETCRKARFMKVHVFPFSRRDGTPAATMPDQVHPEVLRERVRILSDLERELAEQFYQSRVHSRAVDDVANNTDAGRGSDLSQLEVLAERPSETRPGFLRGTDRWYMPVEVPGTMGDVGDFVRCRGVSANRDGVIAERIEPTRSTFNKSSSVSPRTERSHRLNLTSEPHVRELKLPGTLEVSTDSECCDLPVDVISLGIPSSVTTNAGVAAWPH